MSNFEQENNTEKDDHAKLREFLISKEKLILSADPDRTTDVPLTYRNLPGRIINFFDTVDEKKSRESIVRMMVHHALEEERMPMEKENERRKRINTIIDNLTSRGVLVEKNGNLSLDI